jgi:hypothetical protein
LRPRPTVAWGLEAWWAIPLSWAVWRLPPRCSVTGDGDVVGGKTMGKPWFHRKTSWKAKKWWLKQKWNPWISG